jgi:hypothetical protein
VSFSLWGVADMRIPRYAHTVAPVMLEGPVICEWLNRLGSRPDWLTSNEPLTAGTFSLTLRHHATEVEGVTSDRIDWSRMSR